MLQKNKIIGQIGVAGDNFENNALDMEKLSYTMVNLKVRKKYSNG